MHPINVDVLNGPDIALGHAMLEKGRRLGIGQRLRFR